MAGNLDISMVLRLIDEATSPLRGIVAQMEALEGAASKATGGGAVNLRGVSATVEKMDLLAKSLAEVGAPAASATAAMDRLETVTASLSAPVMRGADALEKQAGALRAVESAASGAAGAVGRVQGATERMAHLGMAATGFMMAGQTGAAVKKPVVEAVNSFSDLQSQAVFIANASEQEGQWAKIADHAIAVAKATHTSVASVLAGERYLAGKGGAKYLNAMAPIEADVNKVALVSQTAPADIYYAVQQLMLHGKMTAQQAMTGVKELYQQGKDGPFELRNFAYFLPKLLPLLESQGSKGKSFMKDMAPILQIMRMGAGDPEEANTMLSQLVMNLVRPNFAKNVLKRTGVDIPAVRASAIKTGQDPVLAELNALADRVDKMVAKGADPGMLLGSLGRGRYFARALAILLQHRGDLSGLAPDAAKADKTIKLDFFGVTNTVKAHQQDQTTASLALAYKAGATQEGLLTGALKMQTTATNMLSKAVSSHPLLTGTIGGATYAAGSALEGLGHVGMGIMGIKTLMEGMSAASKAMKGVAVAEAAVEIPAATAAAGLTLISTPALAVVAALTALGGILYWVHSKFTVAHPSTSIASDAAAISGHQVTLGAVPGINTPVTGAKPGWISHFEAFLAGHAHDADPMRAQTAAHRINLPPPAPPLPPVVKVTAQSPVNVTNHITINATTNASAAEIGASVAHAAARGTRAGVASMHDGYDTMGHH